MAHVGAPTAQAAQGGPRSAAPPIPPTPPSQPQQHGHGHGSERSEQKRNLATWWSNFKRSDKKVQDQQVSAPQGIFGVPLQESVRYANVAISLFNDDGQSYIYGYVPIIVAKCGVYLKEKATDVEGIFRLAGSEKRIKELKVMFDSPDRYGKGLDWTGYTVHDAANILRRYFNQLPEPIIPLDFYDRFRDPLRNHQAQAVGELEAQSPSVGHFDQDAAIRRYQGLITELPPLNRQLLLYILDLLAVFGSKSDLNKMTTPNLSAIFQPGILSHPQHDMAPPEYRLSQDVLIFLIENQDSFLIGMQGTAADPQTVRDVQSGGSPSKMPATPTTPGRSKTIVARSASNASAGAESVGKFGSIRRNVSLSSSKRSKKSDGGPTIVTGVLTTTEPVTPSGGVHRSNTVPSRRGGNSPRFPREKGSDASTPSPANSSAVAVDALRVRRESLQSTPIAFTAPPFPTGPNVTSASSSEATTPLARMGSDTSAATRDYVTPKKDTTPLLSPPGGSGDRKTERSLSGTPSTTSGRALRDIFKQSPGSESEGRKPKKLQKKRIPGSALSSAQSSNQSLTHDGQYDGMQRSPVQTNFPPAAAVLASGSIPERSENLSAHPAPAGPAGMSQIAPPRTSGDNALRPTISPTQSYHSTTESDADMVGDDMPREQIQQPEKPKRRHRSWFSRTQNKLDSTPQASPNPLGTMTAQDQTTSRSTIGSSSAPSQPRRSIQEPTPLSPVVSDSAAATPFGSPPPPMQQMQSTNTDPAVFSDSEKERRGPMSWLRGKFKDGRADRETEKRAPTPERNRGSRQDLALPVSGAAEGTALPTRGRSFEGQRAGMSGTSSPPGQQQQTPSAPPADRPSAALNVVTQSTSAAPPAPTASAQAAGVGREAVPSQSYPSPATTTQAAALHEQNESGSSPSQAIFAAGSPESVAPPSAPSVSSDAPVGLVGQDEREKSTS